MKDVRLSFDSLWKKKRFGEDDQNPKYTASFLIDKKRQRATIDDCYDAIDDAKYAKWADKQPSIRDDKLALRDGDDYEYDGYQGHMVVSARSDRRPQVFDRDKTPLQEEDGRIYSGCYVNAVVRFWSQDNKFGKRVNASLEGVQFVRDGPAFGAPPLDPDVFEDMGPEDGDRRGRGRDREDRDDRRSRSSSRDNDREREPRQGRDRDTDRDRGRDRDRDSDRGRDREPPRRSRSREDEDREPPRRGGSRDRDDDFAENDRERVVDFDSRRRSRDDDDRRNRPRRDDLV